MSVHVCPSVCISTIYLYVNLLYSGIHLEIAKFCTFECSWSVSALICNSIGDNTHSGRGTPKSWYEDNREHLQQLPEAGEESKAGLPLWSLSRAKRLHLLQPARFKAPASSHTSTKSSTPRLFQSHSQPSANGVFPGCTYQQPTHQHSVMHSDNDSDNSSGTHSEEEVHLHSKFNEMEMGTVDRCGRVHRTIQSTIKDVSLFASVFLNCIFLTIILFLLVYHNHLPMYSFSWYS